MKYLYISTVFLQLASAIALLTISNNNTTAFQNNNYWEGRFNKLSESHDNLKSQTEQYLHILDMRIKLMQSKGAR